MNLFGKRRVDQQPVRLQPDDGNVASRPEITHYLTLNVSRAMELAAMLARSRASQFIEIPDVLAGFYMYDWDRLSSYWPEESLEHVEEMLREMCQISPQRWNYWIQLYDSNRKEAEPQSRWQKLRKPKPQAKSPIVPIPSATLRAVFNAAEMVSPYLDSRKGPGKNTDIPEDGGVPVLTSECVLLCAVKFVGSETGRKLAESGLDVLRLERAVLDPKRSPLR